MKTNISEFKSFDKSVSYPTIIFLIGCAISSYFYVSTLKKEQGVVYDKYMQRAEVHAKDIEAAFNRSFFQVSSVANLFSSSQWVNYSEFSDFVIRVFPNFPDGRRVTAVHHFPADKSNRYIEKIKQNKELQFETFKIFNFKRPNIISAPTSEKDYYTVISYTYPEIKDPNFYGRNITLRSVIGPLIYPVIENQSPIISNFSAPIKGVRDEPFILYVYPIIQKQEETEQAQDVTGLIISSQYISDLFSNNIIKDEADYFNYILVDKENNQYHYPEKELTNNISMPTTAESTIQFTFPIELINNKFNLIITSRAPLTSSASPLLLQLFIVGILLTLALTFIVRFLLSQQQYLTSEIKRKTSVLDKQKNQLKIQNQQLELAVGEAKVSANAKAEFLANMSHEIRTPLNGVIGLTDLLTKTELDSEQREYINNLSFSGKHLLTVINDILDFSKIESGKVNLEEASFSLYSVVDNLKVSFEQAAKAKGIVFTVAIDKSCHPDLIGDVFRINQVLINLCSNAIKFTESGSVSVIVSMSEVDPLRKLYIAQFEISDTGIGLSEAAIANLFKKFSQADSSTTRKYGGSGLGLTISQKLCQAMDGDISVESILDKGSCFNAKVKLLLNDKVLIVNEPLQQIADKIDVLVVDDNPIALELFEKFLSDIGLRAITAQTAHDGLLAIKNESYDIKVILLDWTMPVMDGNVFIQEVVKLKLDHSPKIIIISAYESASIESYKNTLPISAILQKPCLTSLLFKTIHSCLYETSVLKPEYKPEQHLLGVNFLVVEDNKINQLVINKVLTSEGAVVTIANHGKEAISLINQPNLFQIILMDIHMPVMDGIETTTIIRNHESEHIAKLPIIALTANVIEKDVSGYVQAGMNAHIAKPINIDNLLSTILPFLRDEYNLSK